MRYRWSWPRYASAIIARRVPCEVGAGILSMVPRAPTWKHCSNRPDSHSAHWQPRSGRWAWKSSFEYNLSRAAQECWDLPHAKEDRQPPAQLPAVCPACLPSVFFLRVCRELRAAPHPEAVWADSPQHPHVRPREPIYMISLHIPAMVISTKITYIPLRKLKPFESKHIVLAFCLVVHFCLIWISLKN